MRKASDAVGPNVGNSDHLNTPTPRFRERQSTPHHDRKCLNRVEELDDARGALVSADGETGETCGHEANILNQTYPSSARPCERRRASRSLATVDAQHPIGSTRNGIAGRKMGLCSIFGLMAELHPLGAAPHCSEIGCGGPRRSRRNPNPAPNESHQGRTWNKLDEDRSTGVRLANPNIPCSWP